MKKKKKKDDHNCKLAHYVGLLALRHLVAPPETARVHFLAPWPCPQLVDILARRAEYLELEGSHSQRWSLDQQHQRHWGTC